MRWNNLKHLRENQSVRRRQHWQRVYNSIDRDKSFICIYTHIVFFFMNNNFASSVDKKYIIYAFFKFVNGIFTRCFLVPDDITVSLKNIHNNTAIKHQPLSLQVGHKLINSFDGTFRRMIVIWVLEFLKFRAKVNVSYLFIGSLDLTGDEFWSLVTVNSQTFKIRHVQIKV